MQSDMKEIRNNRILEEMNVIDLFKSERLDVKSEEDHFSAEQQADSQTAPNSDQQDTKNNVRLFLHTNTNVEYPQNSDCILGRNTDTAHHSSYGTNHVPKSGKAEFNAEKSNDNTMNFTSTTTVCEKDQSASVKGTTLPIKRQNCKAECAETAVKVEVNEQPRLEESKETVVAVPNETVGTADNNLLKKYDFIKSYINKKYTEKYEDLEKKLNEDDEDDCIASNTLALESETHPAGNYGVSQQELLALLNDIDDDDVLILESDSGSEESILEVPVAPKPQPPVINLQDSDDETAFDNIESVDTAENQLISKPASCNPETSGVVTNQLTRQMRWIDNCDDYVDVAWDEEDDMVLNCTGLQRATSSINQIREMSKLAENEQLYSRVNNEPSTSNSNDITSQFYIDSSRDNSQLQYLNATDNQDIIVESVVQSNIIPKTGLLAYKQDDTSLKKKRPHENDQESSNFTKQKKRSLEQLIEPTTSMSNENIRQESTNMFQHHHLSNDWPQGQENFDMQKVQSAMSRDPRRWAILDEDLMPCPRRQRFWNIRCTICQEDGHIRQNCPTPRRLPNCRICGITGHIDTRCPDKMCLTCGKKQGTFRKTCESCRILYCNMCKAIGHKLSGCPDLWRRFHQTTQYSEINVPQNPADVMKPPNLLVCCNCTKRGHDASTCREYRWSQHFATPAFVSNYIDGPRYIYPPPVNVEVNMRNTTQCDNQEKNSTHKPVNTASKAVENEKSRSSAPSENKGEKETVLFITGSFHGDRRQQIMAKISKRCGLYDISGIKEGRVKPKFLKALLQTVKFEVKIVSYEDGTLVLTVAANTEHSMYLYNLIRHWLQLQGRDKFNSILSHLPKKKSVMLDLLETKLHELGEFFEPQQVLTEIKQIKNQSANIKDSAARREAEKKLFQLQCKLVRFLQTKPRVANPETAVRKLITELRGSKESTVNPTLYLKILLLYNKIYRPYMPPDLEKHIAKDVRSNGKYNQRRWERFTENIATINKQLANEHQKPIEIRHYNTAGITRNYSTTVQSVSHQGNESSSSSVREPRRERILTRNYANRLSRDTSTTSSSSSVIQAESDLTSTVQIHDILENFPGEYDRSEIESDNLPIVPHVLPDISTSTMSTQQDNTLSNTEMQVPQTTDQSENSASIIDVRLQSDTPQNTTKQSSKNKKKNQTQLNDPASLEKEARVNRGTEHLEVSSNTTDDRFQSEVPQCSPKQTSKSKKKSQTSSTDTATLEKEAKMNLTTEHLELPPNTTDVRLQSEVPQCSSKQTSKNKKKIQAPPVEEPENLETEAKELIRTALEFGIPYITKPAMDIERRLKDKSIEQKHITVLRKLIKLERKHQKKVNTVLMK